MSENPDFGVDSSHYKPWSLTFEGRILTNVYLGKNRMIPLTLGEL